MRVLFVSSEPITPLKPRPFRFIRLLAEDHNVTLVHLSALPGRAAPPPVAVAAQQDLRKRGVKLIELPLPLHRCALSASVGLVRGHPLRVAIYEDWRLRRTVGELIHAHQADVVHIDRARTFGMASGTDVPRVVDLTDPVGWLQYETSRLVRQPARFLLSREATHMWRYETQLAERGEVCFFASRFGADRFKERCPNLSIDVIPNAVEILPEIIPRTKVAVSRPRLCFLGNLGYLPNVDALSWFMATIWPAIRTRFREATLHIIGSHPSRSVCRYADSRSVFLHANPADLRPILAYCDVAVAPVRACGGFPNKVIDPLAMARLPVVATPNVLRGLPASVAETIPTAVNPKEWVDAIELLTFSCVARHKALTSALAAIDRHLHGKAVKEKLVQLYERAIQ